MDSIGNLFNFNDHQHNNDNNDNDDTDGNGTISKETITTKKVNEVIFPKYIASIKNIDYHNAQSIEPALFSVVKNSYTYISPIGHCWYMSKTHRFQQQQQQQRVADYDNGGGKKVTCHHVIRHCVDF